MMNAFAFAISLPAPMPIQEYSVGADRRNHRSLFAGLTLIVKVTLLSSLSLPPVYIQVAAVLFALCRSTRSVDDGSGFANIVCTKATVSDVLVIEYQICYGGEENNVCRHTRG
jgi:hypothetical protein